MEFEKIICYCFFLSLGLSIKAQILKPVKWSYAAKKGTNTATVFIKESIDEGWYIYIINQKERGSLKTNFTFPASAEYSLVGNVKEQKPLSTFDMQVLYFPNAALFQQNVKLKGAKAIVKGNLEFMTCNDYECLPPNEVEFSILIK